MICRIADFNIEFNNPSQFVEKFFLPFKIDALPEDSFSVNADDIEQQRLRQSEIVSDGILELTVFHRKFASWVTLHNAFMLHSALIDVEGTGVAFTALSGTGKTTHMLLWQKLLGNKLTIVNGDKPIVRFFENEKYPYGYGTPWCGKERLSTTGRVPLKHLCFIERGEKNTCERLIQSDVLDKIFDQIYIPQSDAISTYNTLTLADRLLNTCSLWKITCNTDIEAAEVAYNTIFKEQNNEA